MTITERANNVHTRLFDRSAMSHELHGEGRCVLMNFPQKTNENIAILSGCQ